jgi:hypothetical protein
MVIQLEYLKRKMRCYLLMLGFKMAGEFNMFLKLNRCGGVVWKGEKHLLAP